MEKQGLGVTLVAMATALSLSMAPAMADPGNHGPDDNQMDNGPGVPHGKQKHQPQADAEPGQPAQPGQPGLPAQPAQPGAPGMHYQQARRLAVNHGLTGYQPLPPGIAKKMARGKPLPPGIERRPVPPEMLHQLPARPGYEWRIVGDDLVQIAVTTAIVSAIVHGVFD